MIELLALAGSLIPLAIKLFDYVFDKFFPKNEEQPDTPIDELGNLVRDTIHDGLNVAGKMLNGDTADKMLNGDTAELTGQSTGAAQIDHVP